VGVGTARSRWWRIDDRATLSTAPNLSSTILNSVTSRIPRVLANTARWTHSVVRTSSPDIVAGPGASTGADSGRLEAHASLDGQDGRESQRDSEGDSAHQALLDDVDDALNNLAWRTATRSR